MKTMYELYYHSEVNPYKNYEPTSNQELRKITMPDDVETNSLTFEMYGRYDSDQAVAYDTLEEVFEHIDSDLKLHIRKPDEGITVVAINGEPVPEHDSMFKEWTSDELDKIEKLMANR